MRDTRTTETAASRRLRANRVTRRHAIGLIGAASAAWTAACTDSPPSTPTAPTTPTTPTTPGTSQCAESPTETVGPYPSRADFVRSDIREAQPGLPLELTIAVVNVNSACTPIVAAQVEIWQCDVAGAYSQYGQASAATFLRGIQNTDASGRVTFTMVYPGWYQGRATHIHVEVVASGRTKVTQIAFPEDVTAEVYRGGVYASRGQNPTTNLIDKMVRFPVKENLEA